MMDAKKAMKGSKLFDNLKFHLADVDDVERKHLESLIATNGGQVKLNLFKTSTHVVTNSWSFQGAEIAVDVFHIPVVTSSWIYRSLEAQRFVPTSLFRPPQDSHLFHDLVFAVSNISEKDDLVALWLMITANGGKMQLFFDFRCTHLICELPRGKKYLKCKSNGVKTITPDFIVDCCKERALLDEDIYDPVLLNGVEVNGSKFSQDDINTQDTKDITSQETIIDTNGVPEVINISSSEDTKDTKAKASPDQTQTKIVKAKRKLQLTPVKTNSIPPLTNDNNLLTIINVPMSTDISQDNREILTLPTIDIAKFLNDADNNNKQDIIINLGLNTATDSTSNFQIQLSSSQSSTNLTDLEKIEMKIKSKKSPKKSPKKRAPSSPKPSCSTWNVCSPEKRRHKPKDSKMCFKKSPKKSRKVEIDDAQIEAEKASGTPIVMLLKMRDFRDTAIHMTRTLGGKLTSNPKHCTHLVCFRILRNFKFLCAFPTVKYILSPNWLEDSYHNGRFLDENPYILNDEAGEAVNQFVLRDSLATRHRALFANIIFYLNYSCETCHPSAGRLKDIIEYNGGAKKVFLGSGLSGDKLERLAQLSKSGDMHDVRFVVITCPHEVSTQPAVLTQLGIPVMNHEFVISGILQQRLNFDNFCLPPPPQ